MRRESKKLLRYFLWIIILVITYSVITNWIETKKTYPLEKDWFELNVWGYADNDSCLDYGQSGVYYYNDPERYWYKGDWGKNLVILDLNLRAKCDFGQLKMHISATNLSVPKMTYAENKTALQIDRTNQSEFDLFINYSDEEFFYRVQLILPIDNDFYNYYRFSSPKIPVDVVTFNYRYGVFNNGYYATESAFNILEQRKYTESPVEKDRYKRYDFDGEQSVLLEFSPKSKVWFLIQKMIDAIILGVLAVRFYEFPVKESKILFKRVRQKLKV